MLSRREFGKVALNGVGWSLASSRLTAKGESRFGGVYIGIQTFSLRTLPHEGVQDALIAAMTKVGLTECELFQPHAEPSTAEVPDLPKWRLSVPLDYFKNIRKKFNRAGIEINAYNPRVNAATDEEIDRLFDFAKALGAKTLNTGLQPAVAPRVARLAEKHKMPVAITQPNPEILSMSKYFRLCFDIGDSTRAGNDAFKIVRDYHDRLADIHLKDCKFRGVSVPFGQGDSQMKDVLQFLKQKRSPVRARIDCDYPGTGSSVDEVQKCGVICSQRPAPAEDRRQQSIPQVEHQLAADEDKEQKPQHRQWSHEDPSPTPRAVPPAVRRPPTRAHREARGGRTAPPVRHRARAAGLPTAEVRRLRTRRRSR